MMAVTKNMILMLALASGIGGTVSYAQHRLSQAATALGYTSRNANAAVERAFAPFPGAGLRVLAASGKGDRIHSGGCARQTWPNIAQECIVATDGASRRPVRTVTIERRDAEAISVLLRMPEPQLAIR
jgi:hypothetical protein